MICYDMIHL